MRTTLHAWMYANVAAVSASTAKMKPKLIIDWFYALIFQ